MATTRRLVSSVAALLLMAVASPLSTEAAKGMALPGCQATCGGVDIPYPFGIGANCYRDGFEIKCTGSTPFLAGTGGKDYKVLNLSLAPSLARVELPIAWECYNASGVPVNRSEATVFFSPQGVYRISDTHNKFVCIGCDSTAYVQSEKTDSSAPWPYDVYTGCVSYCISPESAMDGRCAGVGCCTLDIPPGLTDSAINFYPDYQDYMAYFYSFSPCNYGFLVDRDSYKFRRADHRMDRNRMMPVWLDWAIRPPNASSALTCADANKDSSSYACKSKNSECFPSANGPGYSCNCSRGYVGNAYIVDGCTDIDECLYPETYPCHGVCRNTVGSYECKCKRGSHGDPLQTACVPDFSRAAQLAIGRLVSSVAALLLMAVASPVSTEAAKGMALPGCQATCGGVVIPYPFGIGANCSRDGFEITCTGNTPFLAGTVYKVLNLSLAPSLARVELPIAWECYSASGVPVNRSEAKVSFNPQGVYRISDTHNKFVSIGCVSTAFIQSRETNSSAPWPYDLYTGCVSYCISAESAMDGQCAGVGCCTVDIPPGLTDSAISFYQDYMAYFYSFSPCNYGFLVDRDSYKFRRADLHMDRNRMMPVWLDWAIRPPNASSALTCADANKDNLSYACKSKNSECSPSANGPGYSCNCSRGYVGNAYIVDGCTDIDEWSEKYRCHGVSRSTVGSYECNCKRGSHGDPLEMACDPDISRAAQLAIGIVCSISFLVILSISMLMVHQKRKLRAFFKRNGGPMLQKTNNIKIFTKEELNQITRNFSTILGKGCFGEVYMGTLGNKQQVAVKRSITVDKARKKEIANEVIIQSQIIHKNLVRLLGCCLEVDVPMLVYEFVPKGSLYDVLHGTKKNIKHCLSLGIRLDVAVDSAEALAYMHSPTAQIILHGDIKSGNILLDDNFMPKVSDFGTSRLLSIEKDHTILVIGDANYIDPVYLKTGLLTEKSDVYSFGVVLLELVTGKMPRYDGNNSLVMNFLKSYRAKDKAREMFDKEIVSGDEDIECLTKVGSIAIVCLKEDVDDRPTMKQVADYLQLVRREWKQRQGKHDQVDEISLQSLPGSSTMVASSGETSSLLFH